MWADLAEVVSLLALSPSVMDRLNPLLEPSGVLTVDEQGIVEGSVPTIKPHPDFRWMHILHYSHASSSLMNVSIWKHTLNLHAVFMQMVLYAHWIANQIVGSVLLEAWMVLHQVHCWGHPDEGTIRRAAHSGREVNEHIFATHKYFNRFFMVIVQRGNSQILCSETIGSMELAFPNLQLHMLQHDPKIKIDNIPLQGGKLPGCTCAYLCNPTAVAWLSNGLIQYSLLVWV